MYNNLNIITAVIASVATVFMAIFAGILLIINRRQHKLDYKQELVLYLKILQKFGQKQF